MSLSVRNITFGYNKEKITLADISFKVINGETVSILGVSGSGKSTLLRTISGLVTSTTSNYFTGEIFFNGLPLSELTNAGTLSFMFQEPALMPNLNVRENVELPLRILNRYNKLKVDEIIQLVGLTDSQKKLPKDLSGGMKTRTALARSFINSPKLLLLDEPFSTLDVGWRAKLYPELKTLQSANNTTIVLVTHDIDEAVELSQRILILGRKGKIIAELIRNSDTKESVAAKAKEIIVADQSEN